MSIKITVKTRIKSNLKTVWEEFNDPEHIVKWNAANEDWHTTKSSNDLRVGGKIFARMEAKDGSFGFDFEGTYTDVKPLQSLSYILEDNRIVNVDFKKEKGQVEVVETFDAEEENSIDMQKTGWQAILDNFKLYVER